MKGKQEFSYSVLLPVYYKDSPEYLVIALDSMLAQTLLPEEIVIAADGAINSGLREVIDDYAMRYGRLFTVKFYPEHRGIWAVLHDTLPLCRNEYIARMDADDYSVPSRIEKQAEIFARYPGLSMVGSNVDEFEGTVTNVISHVILPETPEEAIKFARRRCPVRHSSLLYKKSDIIAAGNYRNIFRLEDYDLAVRVLREIPKRGGGIYNIQEALVYMRVSEDFYRRRGGLRFMLSVLKLKTGFLKSGFISLSDYIIATAGQVVVTLMPSFVREWFYKKFLRG